MTHHHKSNTASFISSNIQTPLPPIHTSYKIPIKIRAPSLSRIENGSLKDATSISRHPSTHRDVQDKSQYFTPSSLDNFKLGWKKLYKSRILEKMKDKSVIASVERSIENDKIRDPELSQHNISKFYLEFNSTHHSNKAKFLTKKELTDLLGLKSLNLDKNDQRIKEVLETYPNCDFLDLSTLKIAQTERNPVNQGTLTGKFKKLLLKNVFDPNKITSNLRELAHTSQNNSLRNPNKRQAVFELAQFLDKISESISISEDAGSPTLDHSVFEMQNACRVCVQSLANEISTECSERGILLAQVWDLNMQLMNIYVQKLERFSRELESKFQKNLINLKSVYQEKFESMEASLQKLIMEKSRVENSLKSQEQDCHFYKEKLSASERIRKYLESDFEELRVNYEAVFIENLKARMTKLEEVGHRSEKEILKKAVDEISRNRQNREKKGKYNSTSPDFTFYKLEGIYQKLTSGELKPDELRETTSRFIQKMTNLSFSILELPNRYEDLQRKEIENNKDINDTLGLFFHDVASDTSDLRFSEEKEVGTQELQASLRKEVEVQTVLIDEIEERELTMEGMLDSSALFRGKKSSIIKLHPIAETPNSNNGLRTGSKSMLSSPFGRNNNGMSPNASHSTIRQRIFTFNQEIMNSLDRNIDFNSLTVSKILDFYSSEMQSFYSLLIGIAEENMHANPSANVDQNIDWFATHESIMNNKGLTEQFIRLIFDRDKKRMNEIISQKIDIIQKNLDLEEAENNFKKMERKFNLISKKFDEFFEFILDEEAQKLNEESEDVQKISTEEGNKEDFPHLFDDSSKEIAGLKKSLASSLTQSKKSTKKKRVKTHISSKDDISIDRLEVLKTIRGISSKNSQTTIKKKSSMMIVKRNRSFDEEKKKENVMIQDQLIEKTKTKEKRSNYTEKRLVFLDEALKNFSKNRVTLKIESPHSQQCQLFTEKSRLFIKKNYELLRSKNLGSQGFSTLVKTVSPLLIELLKRITKSSPNKPVLNPFIYIFYEYMFNRHALSRENAEARLAKVLQSSVFLQESPRIRNYLRLFAVQTEELSDGTDIYFYLENLRELDDYLIGNFKGLITEKGNNIPGIPLLLNTKEPAKIGLNKAIDKVISFFKQRLDYDKYKIKLEDLINKLKAAKEPDPLISRKYVVDVDLVIDLLFWIRSERNKEFWAVFSVIDLERRKALEFNEFALLIKSLGLKQTKSEIVEIFKRESDLLDDEGRDLLSFKHLVSVCDENNWKIKQAVALLNSNITDDIKKFENLKKDWDVKKNLIKLRLIKSSGYTRFYNKIIKKIDEWIQENDEKAWLLYRLLDADSCEAVLSWEVESLLGKEIGALKKICDQTLVQKKDLKS